MKKIIFIFVILFCKNSYCNNFNEDLKNYNKSLIVFDEKGKKITNFFVAIADNEEKRQYGLMNIDKIDEKNGMLFLFEDKDLVYMWMKNTNIYLDMIFIDGNKIISIAKNAKPQDLNIISSKFKVDKVLEIKGGMVEKFGIKNGYSIKF